MNKYFITLKPVEDYFFGGENTFRTNDEKDEVNYFARSNPYPQQTSLLGLMRYMLLRSNNALPLKANKNKAGALIGKESFKPEIKSKKQDFGVIRKLSPLYIYNTEQKKFYRISLETEDLDIDFDSNGSVILHKKNDFFPVSKQFDNKKFYGLILKDTQNNLLAFDKAFQELNPKIGIDKDRLEDDDKKMYKQVFYTLKKPYVFAFFVDLEDVYRYENTKHETKLKNKDIVFFGGEQKRFIFQAQKDVKEPEFVINNSQTQKNKIVLLSDAMVGDEIMEHIDYMINQTQDFRTVKVAFDDEKFNKKKNVSVKFNLLKRGSVIFTEEQEKLLDLFNKNENYSNIGFNQLLK